MNTSLSARALIKSLEGGEEVGDESRVGEYLSFYCIKKKYFWTPLIYYVLK